MEVKYVKMNNNQKELSLGNFCRIVKELSLNKAFAGQQEVFYALFGVDDVSDSTINNYCIGYRAIGNNFKKIYMDRKSYPNDGFDETIMGLYSILKGTVYLGDVNYEDKLMKKLCLELYNLAKNDESVDPEFTKKIYRFIKNNKIYDVICEILLYIVLEKKQPVYVSETNREIFESLLNNTNIAMRDLEKFMTIQLHDGINYTYSLKKLANEGNPYASFELGDLEYTGRMTGEVRYVKAYEYFKVAALKNHPRANWLISKMFFEGKIGNKSENDIEKGHKYLKAALELGSIAAINSMGLCYLSGIGVKKDKNVAIEYFEKAANSDYVYAHNNLGKIYENDGNLEKAYEHYLFSASLKESWASNKLGYWYLKGIFVKRDVLKAHEYFKQALDVPLSILNYWAYFNLAKYFYKNGNYESNTEKNTNKAIEYFEKAIEGNIDEAYIELIEIYIERYTEDNKEEYLNVINTYIGKLSLKEMYTEYKKQIEEMIEPLKKQVILVMKNN